VTSLFPHSYCFILAFWEPKWIFHTKSINRSYFIILSLGFRIWTKLQSVTIQVKARKSTAVSHWGDHSKLFEAAWRHVGYLISLVLVRRLTTCDIAAGTAWNTVSAYENILRRQQQPSQASTADVPAKLNSSQLRRIAGVKACDGCCCRLILKKKQNKTKNNCPRHSPVLSGNIEDLSNRGVLTFTRNAQVRTIISFIVNL